MKSILMSIQPKWCELTASGKKTIEVRKTRPTLETPFKCYIYCTKSGKPLVYGSPVPTYVEENLVTTNGYSREEAERIFGCWNGKVIGEFVCDEIEDFSQWSYDYPALLRHINLYAGTNGDYQFLDRYLKGQKKGYGWHISDLVIYDEPKELGEFRTMCKYRNDDGSCQYEKVECDCVKFDFNPDYSVNLADCLNFMSKPPQSWCYVEELNE